jgi:hypothetical protein
LEERGAKFLTQIWLLIEQRVNKVGLVEELFDYYGIMEEYKIVES